MKNLVADGVGTSNVMPMDNRRDPSPLAQDVVAVLPTREKFDLLRAVGAGSGPPSADRHPAPTRGSG